MKYHIEARVSRFEHITIEANSRREAIKIAESTDGPEWIPQDDKTRQLVSIS